MIAAVTDPSPSRRSISPSSLALGAAALLAAGSIAIYAFGDRERAALPESGNQAAAGQPGSLDDMIASLEQRLRQDPDSEEGWFLLGLSLREGGRHEEASRAFRRAMELAPRNPEHIAYLAESMLLQREAGGGAVPPEAERLFRRVLELEPGNPQARYYLATIRDIGGDHRGAVDDLVALLRDAPANAPWEPQVRQAVTAIAAQNRIDLGNRLPPARAPGASVATAAIPGPTPAQLEAARGIPPSQQDEMVRGMVDRLAARLRANPRDANGWIQLMRSRMVLNDPAAARTALNSGLAAFAGDEATRQRLRAAAGELGVPAA